jgi:hypothetical protein
MINIQLKIFIMFYLIKYLSFINTEQRVSKVLIIFPIRRT